MQFQGTYFDGITGGGQTAQLTADARSVCVSWSGGEQVIGTEDIRVEAALGSVPRRVSWGADDYFISSDRICGSAPVEESTSYSKIDA